MKSKGLQLAITSIGVILLLGHLLFPSVTIDSVSLALIVIVVVPWLAPILKSLELPFFKIELQDVQKPAEAVIDAPMLTVGSGVASKATASIEGKAEGHSKATANIEAKGEVTSPGQAAVESLRHVAGTDPSLALVGFRIEIEKRLRDLARSKNIDASRGLRSVFRDLASRRLLPGTVISSLDDFIVLGNQAAHGRRVDPQAAAWVLEEGPKLLAALDQLFENGDQAPVAQ